MPPSPLTGMVLQNGRAVTEQGHARAIPLPRSGQILCMSLPGTSGIVGSANLFHASTTVDSSRGSRVVQRLIWRMHQNCWRCLRTAPSEPVGSRETSSPGKRSHGPFLHDSGFPVV